MKRRTKGILLVGCLAGPAAIVGTLILLTTAFAKVVDPSNYCTTGFSRLVGCTLHWTSHRVTQGDPDPAFVSLTPPKPHFTYTDLTSWAVTECPENAVARRVLCAVGSQARPVQAASDDLATRLPRPSPLFLTTGKDSRFIQSLHVETPRDLAGTLAFYRAELGKRGWTEDDGAVVNANEAVVPFTTIIGPAQLRLTHQDGRTIVDLSRRKPGATSDAMLPKPGQVRLLLGNDTDEEAVITIGNRSFRLAARAGSKLWDDAVAERKSADSPDLDLPPGKFRVSLKVASGAAQNREFEIAADETWGLLVGKAGVALPIRLY